MIKIIDALTVLSALFAVIVIVLIIKDWRNSMNDKCKIRSVKEDGMPDSKARVLWKTEDGEWIENLSIKEYYNKNITHYIILSKKNE